MSESHRQLLAATIEAIRPLDRAAMAAVRARQAQLTKPPGSLGRLEELAEQIAGITGVERPSLPRKAVVVMAGDHGVVAEGVSPYPREVTAQMVLNFLRGGAAINALARQAGASVVVVDVGVAADLPAHPRLQARKVRRGTANLAREPAMSEAEVLAALAVGIEVLAAEAEAGLDLVATGEMGIGNTTSAAALAAAFTASPAALVTGRGTGVSDEALQRKIAVVERAVDLHTTVSREPLEVLRRLGGLEIAALAGLILAAAARRIPVVLDGFIAGAAALAAVALAPAARPYLIAGHRSQEVGHAVVLAHLGLRPLLDLDLRLGEGTGAVLAMHLIEGALRTHDEMATFAEAAVSGPAPPA